MPWRRPGSGSGPGRCRLGKQVSFLPRRTREAAEDHGGTERRSAAVPQGDHHPPSPLAAGERAVPVPLAQATRPFWSQPQRGKRQQALRAKRPSTLRGPPLPPCSFVVKSCFLALPGSTPARVEGSLRHRPRPRHWPPFPHPRGASAVPPRSADSWRTATRRGCRGRARRPGRDARCYPTPRPILGRFRRQIRHRHRGAARQAGLRRQPPHRRIPASAAQRRSHDPGPYHVLVQRAHRCRSGGPGDSPPSPRGLSWTLRIFRQTPMKSTCYAK
jgi:hypothetical protein